MQIENPGLGKEDKETRVRGLNKQYGLKYNFT